MLIARGAVSPTPHPQTGGSRGHLRTGGRRTLRPRKSNPGFRSRACPCGRRNLSMNVCTVQRLTVLSEHGHESVKLGCLEGGGESRWVVEYLPTPVGSQVSLSGVVSNEMLEHHVRVDPIPDCPNVQSDGRPSFVPGLNLGVREVVICSLCPPTSSEPGKLAATTAISLSVSGMLPPWNLGHLTHSIMTTIPKPNTSRTPMTPHTSAARPPSMSGEPAAPYLLHLDNTGTGGTRHASPLGPSVYSPQTHARPCTNPFPLFRPGRPGSCERVCATRVSIGQAEGKRAGMEKPCGLEPCPSWSVPR